MGTMEDQLQEMLRLSARISQQVADVTGESAAAPAADTPRMHGPRVTVAVDSGMVAASTPADPARARRGPRRRYTARTRTSKEIAQRYRPVLADSRAVVGFRSATKEMQYPIAAAARRARGWRTSTATAYVDITMGFGILLFGHEPDFVARTGPRAPVPRHPARPAQRRDRRGRRAAERADRPGAGRVRQLRHRGQQRGDPAGPRRHRPRQDRHVPRLLPRPRRQRAGPFRQLRHRPRDHPGLLRHPGQRGRRPRRPGLRRAGEPARRSTRWAGNSPR